jgi:putative tryptophan/tyrosine transport system substrate-binding protein
VTSGSRQRKDVKKKITVLTLCAMLFAFCFSAWAQQPTKVPRIGYLSNTNPAVESTRAKAIRLALHELGYEEGRNITIEYRYAEGRLDRYPDLLGELVRLKVDIIVAGGRRVLLPAKNATKTIPVVMIGAGVDQFKEGFVESLARPSGNVTAITELSPELTGKRLELLKETFYGMIRKARFRCIL